MKTRLTDITIRVETEATGKDLFAAAMVQFSGDLYVGGKRWINVVVKQVAVSDVTTPKAPKKKEKKQ
jgi:hypothetical protein